MPEMEIHLERTVDDSYRLIFGSDLFSRIADELPEIVPARKIAIITDSNVGPLYAENLQKQTGGEVFIFPAGEEHKTLGTCVELLTGLTEKGFGRDTAILALGGGVVGDVTGFVAGIYNRGVPYIQIPTTILAQADSSIGGKTGVDTPFGKNLVGVFKQPTRVYLDVSTLQTLPLEQVRSGLAETIKHAIIRDAGFFDYLSNTMQDLLSKDSDTLLGIALDNCRIKGQVVEIDPHEKGLRRILNYGHTAGHAIEMLSDFTLFHGYAVSIGMMVAGRIAESITGYDGVLAQEELLQKAGLPTTIPDYISDDKIIQSTALDKKAKEGKARYTLPEQIGVMAVFDDAYATHVAQDVVREALQKTRVQ